MQSPFLRHEAGWVLPVELYAETAATSGVMLLCFNSRIGLVHVLLGTFPTRSVKRSRLPQDTTAMTEMLCLTPTIWTFAKGIPKRRIPS